jgi:hypothetical protein
MHLNLNNLKKRIRRAITKTLRPLLKKFDMNSSIVMMCADQQIEHVMNLDNVRKMLFERSLQLRAFTFCVAITFLPINLHICKFI